MQISDWIERSEQHFVAWVAEYTREGEGRRQLERFRSLVGDPIFEALRFDLQQRLLDTNEEERKFWNALFQSVGFDLPLHLTLIEPIAQSNGSVSKLISLFPTDLSDPNALGVAFQSLQYGSASLPRGITNTRGWSDQQVEQKLAAVKSTLDWEYTTGSASKWWLAFENENKQRMPLVLRLAEELAIRKATITEFYLAFVYSNTENIQANLFYLDYTRIKKAEEKDRQERKSAIASQATSAEVRNSRPGISLSGLHSVSDSLPIGITNTTDWTDEQFIVKLAEVKEKLDWENTTGSARKWWDGLEDECKQNWALLLRLAEELAIRNASITELFLAYVYSNTNNLRAILFYLDYTRLKKEEEKRKRDKAAEVRESATEERKQNAKLLVSSLLSRVSTLGEQPKLTSDQLTLLREHAPAGLSDEQRALLDDLCRSAESTLQSVGEAQAESSAVATDISTEIVFIGCPKCRRMVPQASSQCKFCGSKLQVGKNCSDV